PRNVGKRQLAGVNMKPAKLGASVQLRKNLARIEQSLCIEGAFDALLLIEIDFREHCRHQVALFDADAVLAGKHATHLDAKLENLGAELFGLFQFARDVGIVKNEGVEISVASVKDIGDAQPIFCRHLFHALKDE